MTRGNKKNCERVDEMSRKLNCFPNSFLPFSPLFLQQPLSHKSYRPLTVASFRLNYLIHQLHPFGYHLVNVLLHSFASILFYRYDSSHQYLSWFDRFSFVFRFCLFFFNETPSKSTVNKSGKIKDCATSRVTTSESAPTRHRHSPCSTSFLIALLFCAHPIHTDSVSWPISRMQCNHSFPFLGKFYEIEFPNCGLYAFETVVRLWKRQVAGRMFSKQLTRPPTWRLQAR